MKSEKKIKLEVGKTYLNCVGGKVKIVSVDPSRSLFKDETGTAYYKNGDYFNCENTSWDLIEEDEGERITKNFS